MLTPILHCTEINFKVEVKDKPAKFLEDSFLNETYLHKCRHFLNRLPKVLTIENKVGKRGYI